MDSVELISPSNEHCQTVSHVVSKVESPAIVITTLQQGTLPLLAHGLMIFHTTTKYEFRYQMSLMNVSQYTLYFRQNSALLMIALMGSNVSLAE